MPQSFIMVWRRSSEGWHRAPVLGLMARMMRVMTIDATAAEMKKLQVYDVEIYKAAAMAHAADWARRRQSSSDQFV
jgi:hypothetical protein